MISVIISILKHYILSYHSRECKQGAKKPKMVNLTQLPITTIYRFMRQDRIPINAVVQVNPIVTLVAQICVFSLARVILIVRGGECNSDVSS